MVSSALIFLKISPLSVCEPVVQPEVQQTNCKHIEFTVNENADQIVIDIHRESIDMSQEFEVLCTTTAIKTMINHSATNALAKAIPNEDYIPVNSVIKFLPGEISKVGLKLILIFF
jgi:hypothetical protein